MHVFQHFNKLTPKEQGRVRSSIRVTELEAPRERAETEVLSTETFFSKTLFFSEIYCWITAAMNSRNRIYNTAVSINSRKNRRSARKCKNEHQVTEPARKGLSTSLEEPAYTSSEVDKYQLGTIYYLPGPARRIQTCLEDTVTYQSEFITIVSRKYKFVLTSHPLGIYHSGNRLGFNVVVLVSLVIFLIRSVTFPTEIYVPTILFTSQGRERQDTYRSTRENSKTGRHQHQHLTKGGCWNSRFHVARCCTLCVVSLSMSHVLSLVVSLSTLPHM